MTREEAKTFLLQFNTDKRLNPSEHEAVRVAIQALSQEPCDDVVSREEVIECLNDKQMELDGYGDTASAMEIARVRMTINDLPSVTHNSGKWIGIDEEPHEDYECSCCGYVVSTFTANIEPHTEYKYCPNCGARMESEE